MMDQPIPFYKTKQQSEEWEDDELAYYSNQTPYICLYLKLRDIV
jgi:hypothetical protein